MTTIEESPRATYAPTALPVSPESPVTYSIPCFRKAGLEAVWANTPEGKPGIYVKDPAGADHCKSHWWLVDCTIYAAMHEHGPLKGFRDCMRYGDLNHLRR